ncbi:MAG: response regulator [Pseudomonadota bacterium]
MNILRKAQAQSLKGLGQIRCWLYEHIVLPPLEPILHPSTRRIQYLGLFMFVGNPLFLWVWSSWLVQPYENSVLRLFNSFLGLLLMLPVVNRDPQSLLANTAFTVISWFQLPVFFSWMYLCNSGGSAWMASVSVMILIWYHVIDWRLASVGLVLGGTAAWALFKLIDPAVMPMEFEQLATNSVVISFSFAMALLLGALSANARQAHLAHAREQKKALTALAGSIAHEMRNPLSQVKYSLDALEHVLPTPSIVRTTHPVTTQDLDTLYQNLSQAQLAIKRGLQVISMTLDEVKGKALNTANFAYLSAEQTVRKAVDEYGYETEGERSKVSVSVVRDFMFKGDETVAIFILFNLIKNALYYFGTKPNAQLLITVDEPAIYVKDTGPGIEPEVLSRLFESFNSVGKEHGTGLGLSYCKRSMQAFGGDIHCTSSLDQYTEFTLLFPRISAAELTQYETAVRQKAQLAFTGKCFLVVDDMETVRRITAHYLQNLGAEVCTAQNGQEAIDKLKQGTFDLIVMDLNMPVLDGYAAAERIRAGIVPEQQHIPIAAFSTEPAFVAQVKAQKVGINAFIGKPCGQFELIQALEKILTEAEIRTAAEPVMANTDPCAELFGRVILVVDDSALNRKILNRYLSQAKVIVVEAGNGKEALLHLAQTRFDLVLLDMQMPEMGGIEVTQLIRQTPSPYQQVKIVMLTANFDEASMAQTYAAGADAFISKPVSLDPQYQEIRQLLRGVARQESVRAPVPQPELLSQATRIPLIDPQVLARLHDLTLLPEVLPIFEIQSAESIRLLAQALASNDLQQASQALHAYKGSSGSIGAQALHEMLRHAYADTQQGRWPQTENWLSQVQTLHRQTLQALANYQKALKLSTS